MIILFQAFLFTLKIALLVLALVILLEETAESLADNDSIPNLLLRSVVFMVKF